MDAVTKQNGCRNPTQLHARHKEERKRAWTGVNGGEAWECGKRKAQLRVSENSSRMPGNIWERWWEQGDETSRERMNNVGSRFSSQGFIPGFRV